jgi:hypothetical protein
LFKTDLSQAAVQLGSDSQNDHMEQEDIVPVQAIAESSESLDDPMEEEDIVQAIETDPMFDDARSEIGEENMDIIQAWEMIAEAGEITEEHLKAIPKSVESDDLGDKSRRRSGN